MELTIKEEEKIQETLQEIFKERKIKYPLNDEITHKQESFYCDILISIEDFMKNCSEDK